MGKLTDTTTDPTLTPDLTVSVRPVRVTNGLPVTTVYTVRESVDMSFTVPPTYVMDADRVHAVGSQMPGLAAGLLGLASVYPLQLTAADVGAGSETVTLPAPVYSTAAGQIEL